MTGVSLDRTTYLLLALIRITTDGFKTAPVRLKPDATFGFETTSNRESLNR
jgi:hypothetical protein